MQQKRQLNSPHGKPDPRVLDSPSAFGATSRSALVLACCRALSRTGPAEQAAPRPVRRFSSSISTRPRGRRGSGSLAEPGSRRPPIARGWRWRAVSVLD